MAQDANRASPKSPSPAPARPERILVAGDGLAGLTAALALLQAGFAVEMCAPPSRPADGRTTALLDHSVEVLKSLGVWQDAQAHAAPLRTMRIIDATRRLIRAPQTDFVSGEIGLDAFGYNVENKALSAIIRRQIEAHPHFTLTPLRVSGFEAGGDCARVILEDGSIRECDAVLAADGRNSVLREAAGIATRSWQHDQVAVVGNIAHTLPHHDTSTEFHTETGPMTVVPLGAAPGEKRSSFVFVESRQGAEELLAMDEAALNREIERRSGSILGKTSVVGKVQSFPLSVMIAESFGTGRLMLIGEAGHVFPPIGAQGFNLGLRDAEMAAEILARAGAGQMAEAGGEFHRRRSADIRARTMSVDLLNRSLLSDFLPVQIARSFGLYTLGSIAPLRRLMMREGVAPGRAFAGLGRRGMRGTGSGQA